jgi:hypothetical protein
MKKIEKVLDLIDNDIIEITKEIEKSSIDYKKHLEPCLKYACMFLKPKIENIKGINKVKNVVKIITRDIKAFINGLETNNRIEKSIQQTSIDYITTLKRRIEVIRNKNKIKFNNKYKWHGYCLKCDCAIAYWNVKETNGEHLCVSCNSKTIPSKIKLIKKHWNKLTFRQMLHYKKFDRKYKKKLKEKLKLMKKGELKL